MKSHSSYRFATMKADIVSQILAGETTITDAAKTVNVSRKTLYQWITKYKAAGTEGLITGKTGPKKGKAWNRTPAVTETYVLQLMDEHRELNIYDLASLLPPEHTVAPCTIFRIHQRSCRAIVAQRMPRKKPQLYIKEKVGQEIQMDTCFPWGYGSQRVSFDCVDDRSRFAIARMYERKTPENAVDFLQYVIAKTPFVIRAVRTDRGTEFGREFDTACALAGIEHIRNDAYSPEQNGKIEKFHDVYKQRCFFTHLSPYASIDEHNFTIWQWLQWYNYVKTHSGLGMDRRTPAAVVYECLTRESVTLLLQPNKN